MESTPYIYTMDELEELLSRWGFLPFFRNKVVGFSIQDVMEEERVFNDGPDCAWKWKSVIISHGDCAYGKFFGGMRAGYIHKKWLPDFMNWRRAVYPLESFSPNARHILEVLKARESMSSRMLKRECGFTLERHKKKLPDPSNPAGFIRPTNTGADFNALISRLQMGTYVCIADFEPVSDRRADSGWTLSVYAPLDDIYDFVAADFDFFASRPQPAVVGSFPVAPPSSSVQGTTSPVATWLDAVEGRTPEQSRAHILAHLRRLFPSSPFSTLSKLI